MFPWIHIDDLLRVFARCVNDTTIDGAVNATAPSIVTNGEFSAELASVMNRPALFAVPAFAINLLVGKECARELLLSGRPVVPSKLLSLAQPGRQLTREAFEPSAEPVVHHSPASSVNSGSRGLQPGEAFTFRYSSLKSALEEVVHAKSS